MTEEEKPYVPQPYETSGMPNLSQFNPKDRVFTDEEKADALVALTKAIKSSEELAALWDSLIGLGEVFIKQLPRAGFFG